MNALLRLDPFRDFERLSNSFFAQRQQQPSWAPPVDIEEDDKDYLFKVELPDVEKDGIKVKVDDGVLAISGERKSTREEGEKKRYHRVERTFGSFQRRFVLPEDTQPDQISADFKNGVLTVRLPKSEKAQPKLIDVKIN